MLCTALGTGQNVVSRGPLLLGSLGSRNGWRIIKVDKQEGGYHKIKWENGIRRGVGRLGVGRRGSGRGTEGLFEWRAP